MNQQFYYQNSFLSSSQPKNAAYFREMARAALKNHWVVAIIAFILASILGAESSEIEFDFNFKFEDMNIGNGSVPFGSMEEMFLWIKQFLANHPALKMGAIIATIGSTLFSLALALFVGAPLKMGYEQLHLDWLEGKHHAGISELFHYFGVCYRKAVVLRVLYILMEIACALPAVLLSLPLVVYVLSAPVESIGIILLLTLLVALGSAITAVLNILFTYNYVYCFMILGEGPQMSPIDALRNSRQLMKGKKWRLFCMDFSFIGWYLLCAVTCGIATFYVAPYHASARAAFFLEISSLSIARETEFPSLNPDDYNPMDESSF